MTRESTINIIKKLQNLPLTFPARRFQKVGIVLLKIVKAYIIICLSYVVLYPLLIMITMAFRETADVLDPSVIWIPKHFTLQIIKETADIIGYWTSVKNTAFISVVSTGLQLITCSLAGYGLARFQFKGRALLFGCVLFTILVPAQTVAIPMFMQVKFFDIFGFGKLIGLFTGEPLVINLYDTPYAMFLPALLGNGIRGGLYVFIFRQFFRGMPLDLEDAASIDGCGILKTFTKIIAPLAGAPFLVTCILSIIWYWNDGFLTSFLFSSSQTLAITIDNLAGRLSLTNDYYQVFSYQMAACLLMILPVLVFYLFLQKFFIQSIDRTGFK